MFYCHQHHEYLPDHTGHQETKVAVSRGYKKVFRFSSPQYNSVHFSDLEHSELAGGVLEDTVDTVSHMETMTPIMISNLAIVLLYSNDESHLLIEQIKLFNP